jgi:Tfp pilus assembly protein PilO
MIPTLKKREQVLAGVIGGALGVWVVVRVIFGPFHDKLMNLQREVARTEAGLKRGVTLSENEDAIRKAYAQFDTYFSLQGASGEEAVAAFLKEIEKLSRQTGLTILDMKPQKEGEEEKFSRQFVINVKAEATAEQVVKFLHALVDSPLLFSVEKMVLLPKGESATALSVTMTVVGVVFK